MFFKLAGIGDRLLLLAVLGAVESRTLYRMPSLTPISNKHQRKTTPAGNAE